MITSFYTCKRPVPYIGGTLDSYYDLYVEQPIVFEQEGTEGYVNRTRVQRVITKATSLVDNWVEMVKWLGANTHDDLYMLCEDDIVFRQRIELPDLTVDYLSPYCSELNAPKGAKGWVTPEMQCGQCGALCIVLPRRSLESLIDNITHFLTLTGGTNLDYAIGAFFKTRLTHVPTMILHSGDISTRATNNDVCNLPRIERARQPAL